MNHASWVDRHRVIGRLALLLAWILAIGVTAFTGYWIWILDPKNMSDIQYGAAMVIPSALDAIYINFVKEMQKDYNATGTKLKLAGIENQTPLENVTFKGTLEKT